MLVHRTARTIDVGAVIPLHRLTTITGEPIDVPDAEDPDCALIVLDPAANLPSGVTCTVTVPA